MSRVGNRAGAGFTLVELLIVLVILGIVTAVATPMITRQSVGFALRSAATDAAAILRQARGIAIRDNREVPVLVDIDAHTIGIVGETDALAIDPRLGITLLTATSELVNAGAGQIRFFPDGTSTGGQLTIALGEQVKKLRIEWITGHAQIIE